MEIEFKQPKLNLVTVDRDSSFPLKRPVMTIQDSDFHSDLHFESHLLRNGQYHTYYSPALAISGSNFSEAPKYLAFGENQCQPFPKNLFFSGVSHIQPFKLV